MSKSHLELAAEANRTATQFFRNHKDEISGCDSNTALIESYLDEHLLDATDPANWEQAYTALRKQLAKPEPTEAELAAREERKIKAEAAKAAESARQQKQHEDEQYERENPSRSEYWTVDRLKAFLKERYQVRGSREERLRQRAEQGLPAEYSRDVLASYEFPRDEMHKLIQRYGYQTVLDRLDGKS